VASWPMMTFAISFLIDSYAAVNWCAAPTSSVLAAVEIVDTIFGVYG
jgi:hypothetical protein